VAVEWLPGPLSLLAYDVLWHERYGDRAKPSVLNCESPGTSTTERGKLEDQAHAELRRAGYLPGSKLVSELHGALDALAYPVNEFTLRWESATPLRAMAACNGDREVVAIFAFPTRTSGAAPQRPVLWVSQLVHGSLAPNLVSFLPPREPARIRSLSVRAQSLAHADDNAR
jgi:EspG family